MATILEKGYSSKEKKNRMALTFPPLVLGLERGFVSFQSKNHCHKKAQE